jgi:hypothetical protein
MICYQMLNEAVHGWKNGYLRLAIHLGRKHNTRHLALDNTACCHQYQVHSAAHKYKAFNLMHFMHSQVSLYWNSTLPRESFQCQQKEIRRIGDLCN